MAKFEEIFIIGSGILLSVVLLIAILLESFCLKSELKSEKRRRIVGYSEN